MNKVIIDDKYINDMLSKYPLVEENPVDLRDYTLDMVSTLSDATLAAVPTEYHIDYNLPVAVKQSWVGACNACTTTAATMIMKSLDRALSWWFVYANRKDSDHQGHGMVTRESLSNIKEYGITLLDLFNVMKEYPEIRDALLADPNKDTIFEEASKYKIGGYVRVYQDEVKSLVAKGIPVMVGVRVYENFYQAINNNYKIPTVATGKKLGAHELLITGYVGDDYECLNWWSGEWDHDLYLNESSEIIMDYYIITDDPINKPPRDKYTVGWNKTTNGKWVYSTDGKSLVKGKWLQLKGLWYYLDNNGYALANQWFCDKSIWYYLKDDCSMAIGWLKVGSDWYYLDKKSGAMQTGWFQDTDGKMYYLEPTAGNNQGHMYYDCDYNIDGKFYHFSSSGAMDKIY